VKFVFLPYLFYASCFISYMTFCFKVRGKIATRVEAYMASVAFAQFFACSTLVCSSHFEGKQIVKNRSEYFLSQGFIWNFLDLLSSILVIATSMHCSRRTWISEELSLVVGGMACFVIWLKIFYYLRIFRPTSSLHQDDN